MKLVGRRTTVPVKVGPKNGEVTIGGGAPVVVQSMTNTDTADVNATVQQVAALARAGSEIVRITVDRAEAAKAGDLQRMQAWAGQSAGLARAEPAGALVRSLWEDARALLA